MPLNLTVLETVDTNAVEYRAASIPGFIDGEIPASALITRAPSTGAKMPESTPGTAGLVGGVEVLTFSGVVALDHSLKVEGGADRYSAEWLSAPLQGQPATLYSQTLADDIPDASGAPDLSDPSWTKTNLRILSLKQVGDEIQLETVPAAIDELDVDIDVPIFSGGDNGVLIIAALADQIEWANGNNGGALEPSLTGDWYYEESGIIIDTGDLTATSQAIMIWSLAASTGIRLAINTTGNTDNIRGTVFQGAVATRANSGDGVLVESRRPVAIGFGRDTGLDVIYVTLNGERVGSTAFTGSIDDNVTDDLIVGSNATLSAVAEFRIWNITPAAEILRSFANFPMDVTNPPAGMVDFFRVGSGSGNQATWAAVIDSNNDSTSASGSASFNYGGQGQPGQHGKFIFPTTAGQVFGLLPEVVDPANITFGLNFEAVSAVSAWFRADEFFDISINSPFTGDVTVNTKPQTDFGLESVRFDFTGSSVADYEAVILFFLTTDNVGPVAPADLASPFVVGPVLDQPAGFHVKPQLTGVAGSRAKVSKTMETICRGAGGVLTKTPAAEWELQRTPPEPYALTDPGVFFLREVGGGEGDFGVDDISVTGAVQANVNDEQTVGFKNFIDPMENPTLGANAAEPIDISRSVHPFFPAKFLRDQAFRDEFPGSEPGSIVPAHFIFRNDAFEEASRRAFSLLAVPQLRRFHIELSRVPEAGVLQLGARVVIISSQHKPLTGIPCFVTGFTTGGFQGRETTGGSLDLMELGRWRVAPDTIDFETGYTGPVLVTEIDDDPMLPSTDGWTISTPSSGAQAILSFPTLTAIRPGSDIEFRCRGEWGALPGSPTPFVSPDMFEGGTVVRQQNPPPLVIGNLSSNGPQAPGDVFVLGNHFAASLLADPTGGDVQIAVNVSGGFGTNVFKLLAAGITYEYEH